MASAVADRANAPSRVEGTGPTVALNTAASAIGYVYSAVTPPANGLTATNVEDALNQCSAVAFNAAPLAKQYTAQQIALEAGARLAADNLEASARLQGDASTLAGANAFTSQQVATEADARQQGDAVALASANTFTLQQVAVESVQRASADSVEIAARQLGDQNTLAAANAYTNAAVGSSGALAANQGPFGFGSSTAGCICTNNVCVGFCDNGAKRSSQIFSLTTLSLWSLDHLIVEFCNSQTNICYDVDVPGNHPVAQEYKHPLAVDSMSVLCVPPGPCDNGINYSAFGYYGTGGSLRAADQEPFGFGQTKTDCSCTNGQCTGFCTSIGDLAKHSPRMFNLTTLSLSDADPLIVEFCNSQTQACYDVIVQPNVPFLQQFEHPLQVDSMSLLCPANGNGCNNLLTYFALGYF